MKLTILALATTVMLLGAGCQKQKFEIVENPPIKPPLEMRIKQPYVEKCQSDEDILVKTYFGKNYDFMYATCVSSTNY